MQDLDRPLHNINDIFLSLQRQLHWLPVQHRIDYKVLNTSVPRYLSQRINRYLNALTLCSTATPRLIQPFARADFAKRSF